jgi:hypothetical protein
MFLTELRDILKSSVLRFVFKPILAMVFASSADAQTAPPAISPNFCGFGLPFYQTGTTYSEIAGEWIVPRLQYNSFLRGKPPKTTEVLTMWVGIDGWWVDWFNGKPLADDNSLIQIGTHQSITKDGRTSTTGFFQIILNGFTAHAQPIADVNIEPGDHVKASIVCSGKVVGSACPTRSSGQQQYWTLGLSVNNSVPFSKAYPYNLPRLSAEWVLEAPAVAGSNPPAYLALPNFGQSILSAHSVNGRNPQIFRSAPNGPFTYQVDMSNPSGGGCIAHQLNQNDSHDIEFSFPPGG